MRGLRLTGFVCLSLLVAAAAAVPLHDSARAERLDEPGCSGPSKKTMTDAFASQVNLTPVPSTVAALRALPVPPGAGEGRPRTGPEKTTFALTVQLVAAELMSDHDFHLLIADRPGGRTMITELPDPTCPAASRSPVVARMAAARNALLAAVGPIRHVYKLLNGRAVITGVGFFDTVHGQVGIAPNGIELHPVLSFKLLRRLPPPHVAVLRWTAVRSGSAYAERALVRLCAPPGHTYRLRLVEHSYPRRHTTAVTGSIHQEAGCTTATFLWRFPATPGQATHRLTLTVTLFPADVITRASR
jgi:hypothetical protein